MKILITNKRKSFDVVKTGKGFFIQRLIAALRKLDVDVTTNPEEKADVELGIGKFPFKTNVKARVLRLGPCHIDTNQDYKKLNDRKIKAAQEADMIVYQSEWARKCAKSFLRVDKPSEVVFNGIPLPESYKVYSKFKTTLLVVYREPHPQKRTDQVIRWFKDLKIEECQMIVIGANLKNEVFASERSRKELRFLGLQTWEHLEYCYQTADILIHMVYLDACPNVVIEGLSRSCRVICGDQGGTKEIAGGNGEVINDKPWDYKPINLNRVPVIDRESLTAALEKEIALFECGAHFDKTAIDIDNVALKYKTIFEKVVNG